MLTAKEEYRQLCETSTRPLIFQTALWLDAAAGENNWDVILTKKGDQITGAFPYVTRKKYGFFEVTLPPLTYYLGPIFFYPSDLKEQNKRSFQKKILTEIIEQIPENDRFITQTDFEFDYWLPFYWKGYEQTTRYTFHLDTSLNLETIHSEFKPNIKKLIIKADEQFEITEGDDYQLIFSLYQQDYKRKGLDLPITPDEMGQIEKGIESSGKRILLEARDQSGKTIAGLYLLKDHQYVHYLYGACDYEYRNSGVMSLLIWKAIELAKTSNLNFNFGGSMNENIEQYFSGFRPKMVPYFRITKTSNRWLKHFKRFDHK